MLPPLRPKPLEEVREAFKHGFQTWQSSRDCKHVETVLRTLPINSVSRIIAFGNGTTSTSDSQHSQCPTACRFIFGGDADEWRPERWTAGEVKPQRDQGDGQEPGDGKVSPDPPGPDKIKTDNELKFSYGSRICVRRELAVFKIYKFIAQLLSRYEVELEDASKSLETRSLWFAEL